MDNDRFLKKLKKGDEQAFEQLVGLYQNQIYKLALRYTNNEADAMDVTQEVFLKVYRSLPGFKGDSALNTWIYRIAVNTALDLSRKKSRRSETGLYIYDDSGEETECEIADENYSPQLLAEKSDIRAAVSEAVALLPDGQKQPLILRDINGLSYEQIASVLGLSAGTVKSRIFRARSNLREILTRSGTFSEFLSSKKEKGGEEDE